MHKGSGSEHATAVLLGSRALLIRGPSGSGKSRLAWSLLEAADRRLLRFARLIADDRVALSAVHGRLIAATPKTIEGLIELRGAGVQRVPFERYAVVGMVVDLAAADAERVPPSAALRTAVLGVTMPRLPVAERSDPLLPVLKIWAGLGFSA